MTAQFTGFIISRIFALFFGYSFLNYSISFVVSGLYGESFQFTYMAIQLVIDLSLFVAFWFYADFFGNIIVGTKTKKNAVIQNLSFENVQCLMIMFVGFLMILQAIPFLISSAMVGLKYLNPDYKFYALSSHTYETFLAGALYTILGFLLIFKAKALSHSIFKIRSL